MSSTSGTLALSSCRAGRCRGPPGSAKGAHQWFGPHRPSASPIRRPPPARERCAGPGTARLATVPSLKAPRTGRWSAGHRPVDARDGILAPCQVAHTFRIREDPVVRVLERVVGHHVTLARRPRDDLRILHRPPADYEEHCFRSESREAVEHLGRDLRVRPIIESKHHPAPGPRGQPWTATQPGTNRFAKCLAVTNGFTAGPRIALMSLACRHHRLSRPPTPELSWRRTLDEHARPRTPLCNRCARRRLVGLAPTLFD